MNTAEGTPRESGSPTAQVVAKRGSRRLIAGLVAGLAATAGIGLVVQSASAAQMDAVPMGAQLPWDDSNSPNSGDRSSDHKDGDRRLGDRMHDRHGVGPMAGRRLGGPREMIATVAEELGITVEDLVIELKNGKSIAEVAEAEGVAVQDVVDALVDEVVAEATERITELVNRKADFLERPNPQQ